MASCNQQSDCTGEASCIDGQCVEMEIPKERKVRRTFATARGEYVGQIKGEQQMLEDFGDFLIDQLEEAEAEREEREKEEDDDDSAEENTTRQYTKDAMPYDPIGTRELPGYPKNYTFNEDGEEQVNDKLNDPEDEEMKKTLDFIRKKATL